MNPINSMNSTKSMNFTISWIANFHDLWIPWILRIPRIPWIKEFHELQFFMNYESHEFYEFHVFHDFMNCKFFMTYESHEFYQFHEIQEFQNSVNFQIPWILLNPMTWISHSRRFCPMWGVLAVLPLHCTVHCVSWR